MPKHAFGCGRAANIAHANKQNADLLFYFNHTSPFLVAARQPCLNTASIGFLAIGSKVTVQNSFAMIFGFAEMGKNLDRN